MPKIGEESWHNFSYLYREPASLVAFLRFNRFACIACFNFIASVDKLRIFINSANFAKKYGRVSLTLQKSPGRRCDLSRRKHCCRHPIEQGLKEVMIRSINHHDIGVCTPKGFSGSEPGKTGADNHDSLHSLSHSRGAIAWGICDLTMARMSRFSRIRPWRSSVSRSTTSTIAQAKSSARTT